MLFLEKKERIRKILIMCPLFVLFNFGYVLSGIAGKVLFVEKIGSDYLPYVYISQAFFAASFTIFIGAMVKRMSLAKVLQIFSWVGALVFLGIFLLMRAKMEFSYVIFLIFGVFFYLVMAATAVWRMAASLSTLFEAKIVFIYYSLAYAAGGILAGLASSYLAGLVGMEGLVFLIGLSLLLAAINLVLIERKFGNYDVSIRENVGNLSQLESAKKEFIDFNGNRLAKILFLILTIFNVAWWVADFEFQKIVGEALSQQEYAKLASMLVIANNALLIFVLLFLQGRIFRLVGVLNTLFLSPVLVLVPFLFLLVFPGPMAVFILNVIVLAVGHSIFSNSSQFVVTALPVSIRNSVSTFIYGNADAFAILLAGVGLAILTKLVVNFWILALGAFLLILCGVLIIFMKKEYEKQVVNNLSSGNSFDVNAAIENLAEPAFGKIGVNELTKKLFWQNLDNETVRKIVFSLGKIDNVEVIPALLEVLSKHDETVKYSVIEAIHSFSNLNERLKALPFTRLNIIEAYEKIFLEEGDFELKIFIIEHFKDFDPDKVIVFLKKAINSKSKSIRFRAISALRYFNDRGIITYVRPHLTDHEVAARAAAVVALWQFPELKPLLIKNIAEMMADNSHEYVLASLMMIGKLGLNWEISYVKNHVKDADEAIRNNAILALLMLGDESCVDFAAEALSEKTPAGGFFAKGLKEIPVKMKDLILGRVYASGEEAVNVCVKNLKETYLNFTDEIQLLTVEASEVSSICKKPISRLC